MDINFPGFINASIPIVGGTVATIFAYRKALADTTSAKRAIPTKALRWLGPIVIVFGLWQLSQNFVVHEVTAEDIVHSIRQKRSLPAQIDEATRLDAVDANRNRVVFLMTVLNPESTRLDPNSLVSAMRPNLRRNVCSNQQYVEFLKKDIAFEYIYTVGREVSPSIVITKADCV